MSLLDLALLVPHGVAVVTSAPRGLDAMSRGEPTTCEERNAIVATLAAALDVFARPVVGAPASTAASDAPVVGLYGETFVAGDSTLRVVTTPTASGGIVADYVAIDTAERRRAWEETFLILHGMALNPSHVIAAPGTSPSPQTHQRSLTVEIVGNAALAASIYSVGSPLDIVSDRRIATPPAVASVVADRVPRIAAFAASLRGAQATGSVASSALTHTQSSQIAVCMEDHWRREMAASTTQGIALAVGTAFGVGAGVWVGRRAWRRVKAALATSVAS